jgi:hypothetical protein
MSALFKFNDEDKTAEVEIPESILKSAQKLKKEQQDISHELEKAKSEEVVRKTDESTKVFNLRQHTAAEKVRELELRKLKAERELNALLQQKNSKLHEELKKATDVLLIETKKIAPLEKEFESRMSKISNLKNEMQQFFESSLDERKKNSFFIENQTKEINQVGSIVKETMVLLQKDVHQINVEIEKLTQQKLELISYLGQLKEEIFLKEGILRLCESKKNEMTQLDFELSTLKQKVSDMRDVSFKYSQLQSDLLILQSQFKDDKHKLDSQLQEVNEVKSQKTKLIAGINQLEVDFTGRRHALDHIEKEILESRIKLDSMKSEEFQREQELKDKELCLSKIQDDIIRCESQRSAMVLMQEEVSQFYQQKKEVYVREMNLLDQNFELKKDQLELEFANRKAQWELDFLKYCDQKETEQKLNIIKLEQHDIEEVRRKRSEFLSLVLETFKKQLANDEFVSKDQKIQGAQIDLENVFDRFYGKIVSKKFW